MPVRKLAKRQRPREASKLKKHLVSEWKKKKSTAPQPIIIEEGGGAGQPLHVYVIWDEWNQLSSIERSEIIMDAFEEVHGKPKALNVSVAMGLTPVEADRMGIRYE